MTEATPRGIRNNNPGNLAYIANDPFEGQLGLEVLPPEEIAAGHRPRFGRYETPFYGLRALGCQLLIDQDRYKLTTPRTILIRYAPESENDTGAYIADVDAALQRLEQHMDLGPDSAIDLHDEGTLESFMKAVIKHEDGSDPYSDVVLDGAAEAALKAHPPAPPAGDKAGSAA
ncbi:MAG TPA: structural protein [Thermoanaerobaculia bacterium]|nr:structural protein [Thermoanaerobaculia bacterium]